MNYVDPSSGMYFRKRGGFLVSLAWASAASSQKRTKRKHAKELRIVYIEFV